MPLRRTLSDSDEPTNKIYPYMVKMASSSYIHGVKEIYSSRTVQEKVFWIMVCLLCSGAAAYEICQIIVMYREKSVATKIHITSVTTVQYPTLLVCPTKWVSTKKVLYFHLDDVVLSYLFSIFQTVVPTSRMDLRFQNGELPEKVKSAMEKTRSPTLADLALNISINMTKENVKCNPLCCNVESMKKIVTLYGVCFILELCNSSFQSREKSPHLLFTINTTDARQNFDMIDGGLLALYEKRWQIGVPVNDHIILFADTMTMIKLSLASIKRISSVKTPCQNEKVSKTSSVCEFECIDNIENRMCNNCSKCSIFNATLMQSMKPCLYTEATPVRRCSKETLESKLTECKSKCTLPCQETIYNVQSVTAIGLPKSHSCGADDKTDCLQAVLYFPSFTQCEFEDIPTLTGETFISAIGGQTGLWCGASVVSLCQILSYFCCPCLHWGEFKKNYKSFRSAKKEKNMRNVNYHIQRRHSDLSRNR